MEKIHPHAAGIDIGAKAVFLGLETEPVRSYGTFTSDFKALASYLLGRDVLTVAMEATGVY